MMSTTSLFDRKGLCLVVFGFTLWADGDHHSLHDHYVRYALGKEETAAEPQREACLCPVGIPPCTQDLMTISNHRYQ